MFVLSAFVRGHGRQANAGVVGEASQGFDKTQPVKLAEKRDGIAALSAAEAVIGLAVAAHRERRGLFVVKRAQRDKPASVGRFEFDRTAHHVHNFGGSQHFVDDFFIVCGQGLNEGALREILVRRHPEQRNTPFSSRYTAPHTPLFRPRPAK